MPAWTINKFLRSPFLPLAALELAILYSSVFFAGIVLYGSLTACEESVGSVAIRSLVIALVMFCGLVAVGLYQFNQRIRIDEMFLRIVVVLAGGSIVLASLYFWVPALEINSKMAMVSVAYSFVLLFGLRVAFTRVIDQDLFRRRTIIFGAGERATAILDLRRRADRRGFKIVGQVRAPGDARVSEHADLLDSGRPLLELAREARADEIVISMDNRRGNLPIREFLDCKLAGLEIIDLIEFLERESGKIRVDLVNPSWLFLAPGFRVTPFRRAAKRALDLVASTIALILAMPVMLLTALAIKIEDGIRAPVFYHQRRVGYQGHEFFVLKFRSMSIDAESDGKVRWARKNDDRVTRVGKLIRKIRVDELPQLLNVVMGQMSIVGPRPERPEFVEELSKTIPFFAERHSMKPGITGWAQMNYPYGSSEEDALQKLQYDLYYVKNHSILLDLLIMLQTVEVILWGRGAR